MSVMRLPNRRKLLEILRGKDNGSATGLLSRAWASRHIVSGGRANPEQYKSIFKKRSSIRQIQMKDCPTPRCSGSRTTVVQEGSFREPRPPGTMFLEEEPPRVNGVNARQYVSILKKRSPSENLQKKAAPLIKIGRVIDLTVEDQQDEDLDCLSLCSRLQPRLMTDPPIPSNTIFRCLLCNHLTFQYNLIENHFKRAHKLFEAHGQDIDEYYALELRNVTYAVEPQRIRSPDSSSDNDLLADYIETTITEVKKKKDSDGSLKRKTFKKKNQKRKTPKNKLYFPAQAYPFMSDLVIPPRSAEQNLQCGRCDFKAQQMSELRQHMVQHRLDPNAWQCLDCGECYVVRPSFEKHLIIYHRITDHDKYVAENPSCRSQEVYDEVDDSDDVSKSSEC